MPSETTADPVGTAWLMARDAGAMSDPQTTVHGDIEVITNRRRQKAFVRVGNIAAVVEVCEGGPTNLIFTAGGELEICGDAQYWRRCIAIAALECKP